MHLNAKNVARNECNGKNVPVAHVTMLKCI